MRAHLLEISVLFLRLGLTAFGGPAAHIALMRQECVERRGWLTETEYLDLLGASHLIPGPSSTELALHIGLRRAGGLGLILAGVCFILPAALLVTLFAWVYCRYGRIPQTAGVLHGVEAVIVAVVAQALWGLGRVAWKTKPFILLGMGATALAACGVGPLSVMLGAGTLTGLIHWMRSGRAEGPRPLLLLALIIAVFVLAPEAFSQAMPHKIQFSLLSLFLIFIKFGATVLGSGYVLLAFLRDGLVTTLHWLTSRQLLDAVGVGQVTPGPVFTTAAFIGYLKAGPAGAVLATLGIFFPAFIFVAVSGPLLPRLRRSRLASAFMDGINVAAVAIMVIVTWQFARTALSSSAMVMLALLSLFVLLRFRVNSAWLIFGGAVCGLLLPPYMT